MKIMQNYNPFFCPKCSEIRGLQIGKGTLLIGNENLYFHSFGMCTQCREFLNTHSQEEIQKNKDDYEAKLAFYNASDSLSAFLQPIKNIVLYYVDSPMISTLTYINNLIIPLQFSSYEEIRIHPQTHIKYSRVRKLIQKINTQELTQVESKLKSNGFLYWIENDSATIT